MAALIYLADFCRCEGVMGVGSMTPFMDEAPLRARSQDGSEGFGKDSMQSWGM